MQVVKELTNWGQVLHPQHKYSIAIGGFIAWPTHLCSASPVHGVADSSVQAQAPALVGSP